MNNQELVSYIKAQLLKKVPSEDIKKKLVTAGWDSELVATTLDQLEVPDPTVPAPPPQAVHFGMWVAFLYLIFFISLYVFASSVAGILHVGVDRLFPDILDNASSWFDYSSNELTRFSLSALIVSYPIFAVLLYFLGKQAFEKPQVKSLRTRKLCIYITLVGTFILMLGHLIATIYGFISDGDITARVVGHLGVTFLVAGSIFGVLLYIVRGDRKTR